MTLRNTVDRWGSPSRFFHWLSVLLIVAIAAIGLTMGELPAGTDKIRVYALHKSLGLTLLAVVLLRLAWRLHAGAAPPVPGTPRWQARVADLTHWALYALMLAMPLTGWWLNSTSGYPLQWFGLIDLPAIAATDHARHELAEELHETGFWVLVALVAAHVGAAVWHHVVQRDATLRRMLPGAGTRLSTPAPREH